jgi:HEAT repeat protein
MKRLSLAVISLIGLALVGTVCAPGEAGTPAEKPADVAREPIPADLPKEIREQIEQLRSESEAARVRAAQALGKMKAAAAAPFLTELLADEAIDIAPIPEPRDGTTISAMEWQVCREASKALLAIGPPAVEPLAKALQHRTPLVRVRAAGLLVQLSDARGRDTLLAVAKDVSFDKVARWDAMETLATRKEPGVVEPLIAELKNPDHLWRAARLLGEAGNSRATEPLVRTLAESRDWSARAMVLEALGKIGKSPQELDLLLAALKDDRKDVRLAAALALGKMADRRAVEPLIATLQDKDSYVRLMAASALGDIGDSRAVEPLLKTFKDDLAEDTRSYAAEALGKINSAPANEAVLTVELRPKGHPQWQRVGWHEGKWARLGSIGVDAGKRFTVLESGKEIPFTFGLGRYDEKRGALTKASFELMIGGDVLDWPKDVWRGVLVSGPIVVSMGDVRRRRAGRHPIPEPESPKPLLQLETPRILVRLHNRSSP